MSETMTATADQWMQFYQQSFMDDHHHHHGHHALLPPSSSTTVMTTSPTTTMPSESMLSPKGNVSKPIRRRSRASKRTPTTLLNANTNNFKVLVQQFTGCSSTSMMSSSLGVHKGPITLNFQQGSKQKIHHSTSGILMQQKQQQQPFGLSRSYSQVHQVAVPIPWQNKKQPDQEQPQQQLSEQEISDYPFEYVNRSKFLPCLGNSMEVSDGLVVDDDFNLYDLSI